MPAFGQNPQTTTAPIDLSNAKYVQGIGPGYRPTKGAGLTVNFAAGTCFDASDVRHTYAGGTDTATDNATTYFDLKDSDCSIEKSASGYQSRRHITSVVASGGVIVGQPTDDRGAATASTAAPVTSVFGRTGAVVKNSGDYACSDVTNCLAIGGSSGNLQYNNGGVLGGFADGTSTQVLHGGRTFGAVVEGDLGLTDLTTANASTSAHGFLKKLDNNEAHFMNGQGNWSTPSGYSLPRQYTYLRCEGGWGDGLNAIAAGTYLQYICYNNSGVTWTITRIACFSDNSGSSTLNATNNAGTGLLTGAVTCGTTTGGVAGTQSGTTTLANGDWIKFTGVADGSSKQIGIFVGLSQ